MNCYEDESGPRISDKTISQKKMDYGFRTIDLVEEKDGKSVHPHHALL